MSTQTFILDGSLSAPDRNLVQEQQNLAVQQGTISESDLIVKNWEHSEFLIRKTISSISFVSETSGEYSMQVHILKEESNNLTRLFDRIGEIILNEPTFCRIKQSTILGWGTSIIGLTSGGAGVGTVLYNYLKQEAPSIAPVILTAGGVAVVGFQVHFWNRLKKQQEERTKLLILRSRCEVITEAREMARLLEKLTRIGKKLRAGSEPVAGGRRHELLMQLRNYRERVQRLPEIERCEIKKQESVRGRIQQHLKKASMGYTAQSLLEASKLPTHYTTNTPSNSAEAPPYLPNGDEEIMIEMRSFAERTAKGTGLELPSLVAGEAKGNPSLETVIEMSVGSSGYPKTVQSSDEEEVEIFEDK